MRFFFMFSLVWAFTFCGSYAQELYPQENDTLNYRLIGFRFPALKNTNGCRLEIAMGRYNDESAFQKNVIKKISCTQNSLIAEVPRFGREYTWRIAYDGTTKAGAIFHHFSTGIVPAIDSAGFRLMINKKAEKYKDAYIFLDGSKALYDMEGNPVWYLPDLGGVVKENSQLRDLKITDNGTITLLVDGKAFEIDYKGKVLWEGPNGRNRVRDTMEGYHHEMTRLSNGHYMILAFEPMVRPVAVPRDLDKSKMDSIRRHNKMLRKPRYGEVKEYDATGNIVWIWKAGDYFNDSNLEYYKRANGAPEADVHMNSFYFDEKSKMLYVSFRNLSQVLKVAYPSGNVIAAYGAMENLSDSMENHFFCGQHSCKVSAKGHLYLYNNGCEEVSQPSVVMLDEPKEKGDSLKVTWSYKLPLEPRHTEGGDNPRMALMAAARRYNFTSGGNVEELPDHSIFVSTNGPYGDIFIISQDKKVLWAGEVKKWHIDKKDWLPFMLYRASIITGRKDVEKLIWTAIR